MTSAGKGLALISGYIVFGAFLILFALSEWLLLSLTLIAIAYASATLYETVLETLLQTSVPERDARSRAELPDVHLGSHRRDRLLHRRGRCHDRRARSR